MAFQYPIFPSILFAVDERFSEVKVDFRQSSPYLINGFDINISVFPSVCVAAIHGDGDRILKSRKAI